MGATKHENGVRKLLAEAPPTAVADLSYGVLDTAMVETATNCLRKRSNRGTGEILVEGRACP